MSADAGTAMGWKLVWNLLLFVLFFHYITRRNVLAGPPFTLFAIWRNAFGARHIPHAGGRSERLNLNAWATEGFLAAHGMTGAPLWKGVRVVVTAAWWILGSALAILVGIGALRGQPDHFAAFDVPLYLAFLFFLLLEVLLGFLQAILDRIAGIPFQSRARLEAWFQRNPLESTAIEKPVMAFAKLSEQAFGRELKKVPWWFTPGNPLVRWPAWMRTLASPLAAVLAIMVYGLLEGKHFAFSDAGDVVVSGFFLVFVWVAPLERTLQAAPWTGYDAVVPALAVSWMLEDFGIFPD
ncbi:MAG: hypothetical protein ACYDA7_11555 [Acidithiobacillus sp.]